MKKWLVLIMLVTLLTGCTNEFNAEEGYRMSLVNYGFPVPKNAGQLRPEACTGDISKSAKYKLRNIGGLEGESPQPAYLDEILAWNWTEMEEKRSDSARFYMKNDKVICVVFQENTFDVFEITMKK